MENSEVSRTARLASIAFLGAVIVVCVESIAGWHQSADVALAMLVMSVSALMVVALVLGPVLEDKNKKEKK